MSSSERRESWAALEMLISPFSSAALISPLNRSSQKSRFASPLRFA